MMNGANSVFDMGRMAARSGLPLSDNPYVGPEQREYTVWREGWMEEDNSNDARFLRRLATDKRKETNRADNEIDRLMLVVEYNRLKDIADKLERHERFFDMMREVVAE